METKKYFEVKRSKLYQEIWTKSAMQLAKKYGISDTALVKICTRNNIPKPPVGYWAKVKHNVRTKKQPLPHSNEDTIIRIQIKESSPETKYDYGYKTEEANRYFAKFIEKEASLPSKNKSKMKNLHPFVRDIKEV